MPSRSRSASESRSRSRSRTRSRTRSRSRSRGYYSKVRLGLDQGQDLGRGPGLDQGDTIAR